MQPRDASFYMKQPMSARVPLLALSNEDRGLGTGDSDAGGHGVLVGQGHRKSCCRHYELIDGLRHYGYALLAVIGCRHAHGALEQGAAMC
jgi:hypothetical protein